MRHTVFTRPSARVLSSASACLRRVGRSAYLRLCASAFFVACVAAANAPAQNIQYTQGDVGSGLEQAMQIPIRTYPGRGAANLPVTLYYSSKVWRIGYIKTVSLNSGIRNSVAEAIYAEDSTAGWTTGLDLPRVEWPKQNDLYWYDGKSYHSSVSPYTYRVANVVIHMPDGSAHELRKSDQVYQDTGTVDVYGTFYAVDGSRMRYDSTGATTGTLYLPDGTRYVLNSGSGQLIDRNGNTLNFDGSTRQWTDALGRTIGMPWPASPQATDYYYTPLGMPAAYVFKWRNLSAALTPDAQGQMPALKAMSSHYLPFPGSAPTNQNSSNFPQASGLASLFYSDYGDESADNPDLTYTYVVGRGQSAGQYFNPVVLSEIVLPDNTSYKFTYNVYGELDKVVYPTGGYNRYQYSTVPMMGDSAAPYTQGSRGVTSRWVSPKGTGGADEAQWQYQPTAGMVRTIAPDGTRTETYRYNIYSVNSKNFGYQDARNGQTYEERVYDASGAMIRRTLSDWAQTSATYNKPRPTSGTPATGTYTAYRNSRSTKTVNLLLDTQGNALTSTATYGHDTTYQFSTGVELTSAYEYNYTTLDQTTAQTGAIAAMPVGTLARISETTYLTGDPSYRNRNILGLATSEVVKDGVGNVVARKETYYDEAAYPLLTYGAVTGWGNPGTTARGNPTTVRQFIDPASGVYIETHTQYDQCGSERNAWDPHDPSVPGHGHMSQITYDDSFSDGVNRNTYAYPTRTTSPVPDPSGARGSTTSLEKTTVYEYATGLATSTTDVNGAVTTNSYVDDLGNPDPLKRLRKVTRPAGGGWTKYVYGVSTNIGLTRAYVQTINAINGSQQSSFYQFYDGLGRPDRTFNWVGGTAFDTADTQYDQMGRAYRTSQPYRTSGSGDPIPADAKWTTTTFDSLGRVRTVTTCDGAVVDTSYKGNEVTFADQTLKRRRSLTDALGRMVKVIEDPLGAAYQTDYTYDALGNVRKIDKGGQLRYFMYDGISRLIRARNPEQDVQPSITGYDTVTGNQQWTLAIAYDLNGNIQSRTDARGVVTNYTYDNLNRQLTVSYQSDPANTPAVNLYYDNQPNARGQLWKTATANDYTETLDRDTMGRPQRNRQWFYSGGVWRYYDTTYAYDLAGHVTLQTYPSGRTVSNQYDVAGRLVDFRGTLGDGASRVYSTGITYDEASRVKQEQYGTTTPVYNKSFYNVRGQLSEIRVATTANDTFWNRGAIINHYSDQSWAGSGTDNNGSVKKQDVYIPNDDAISGYSLTTSFYYYDALNRVDWTREVRGGANSFVQDYDYDQYGNRTINAANTWGAGVNNRQFTVSTATNRLGVPAGQPGAMAYDMAGNLTTDTYSGAAGTRSFDAENRLYQELTSTNAQTARYAYDGGGRRVRRTAGGQEWWYVYGLGNGELVAEYAANSSATSAAKEYGYRNGELLITASGQGCGVGYQGTKTWGATNGSIGHQTGGAQGSDWVSTAGVNSAGFMSYGPYDGSFGQGHHTAGFLIQVDNISGSDVVATLDVVTGYGANVIAQKQIRRSDFTAANQWQWFTLEFDNPCFGLVEARINWHGNTTLRENQVTVTGLNGAGASVEWMVVDQLGTPRMVIDKTGSLSGVTRHDYLPFGEELTAGIAGRTSTQGYAVDGVRQQFTGHERDAETGLDFMQARHYSGQQGRFVSVDTVSGTLADPQSLNLYAYSVNNPLRYTDPSGHAPIDIGVIQTDDPATAAAAQASSFNAWILSIYQQHQRKQGQRTNQTQTQQQQQKKKEKPKQTSIAKQIAEIKKNARQLAPGEQPVPTTIRYLEGDNVTYDGDPVTLPDGTPDPLNPGSAYYGTGRINAIVVLDQGGNIMPGGTGLEVGESVTADNAYAQSMANSGKIVASQTPNGQPERVPLEKSGIHWDRQLAISQNKSDVPAQFDMQVTQRLYVYMSGQKQALFTMTNKHQITQNGAQSTLGTVRSFPRKQ